MTLPYPNSRNFTGVAPRMNSIYREEYANWQQDKFAY